MDNQVKHIRVNRVTAIAYSYGREYITPEDVQEAVDRMGIAYTIDDVRLGVLEVLSLQTGFGAEDSSLCAFVAYRGERDV